MAAACLGMCLAPRIARADEKPSPTSTAEVTPPRLVRDVGVVYPEQALREGFHESVTSSVLVDVDASGQVTDAKVEAALGHGFDEAAIAAAKALAFEPALRGGHPVAARIRFRYAFDPPAPRLKGRVLRRADDAPVAKATVTVHDAAGADQVISTGADGGFVVDKVASGPVRVTASSASFDPLTTEETLTAGEETVLVVRLGAEVRPHR